MSDPQAPAAPGEASRAPGTGGQVTTDARQVTAALNAHLLAMAPPLRG
jgi:hypothetical protein